MYLYEIVVGVTTCLLTAPYAYATSTQIFYSQTYVSATSPLRHITDGLQGTESPYHMFRSIEYRAICQYYELTVLHEHSSIIIVALVARIRNTPLRP